MRVTLLGQNVYLWSFNFNVQSKFAKIMNTVEHILFSTTKVFMSYAKYIVYHNFSFHTNKKS